MIRMMGLSIFPNKGKFIIWDRVPQAKEIIKIKMSIIVSSSICGRISFARRKVRNNKIDFPFTKKKNIHIFPRFCTTKYFLLKKTDETWKWCFDWMFPYVFWLLIYQKLHIHGRNIRWIVKVYQQTSISENYRTFFWLYRKFFNKFSIFDQKISRKICIMNIFQTLIVKSF